MKRVFLFGALVAGLLSVIRFAQGLPDSSYNDFDKNAYQNQKIDSYAQNNFQTSAQAHYDNGNGNIMQGGQSPNPYPYPTFPTYTEPIKGQIQPKFVPVSDQLPSTSAPVTDPIAQQPFNTSTCVFNSYAPMRYKHVTQITYLMRIHNVKDLEPQCSQDVVLWGISFKIAIAKDSSHLKHKLAAHLITQTQHSVATNEARHLDITIKLNSTRNGKPKTLKFSNILRGGRIEEADSNNVMKIGDLFEYESELTNYTKMDAVLLEINFNVGESFKEIIDQIDADTQPATRSGIQTMIQTFALIDKSVDFSVCQFDPQTPLYFKDITEITFALKIPNVEKLGTICSQNIALRGITWSVLISKEKVNSVDTLAVYLMTEEQNLPLDVARSFKTTVKLYSMTNKEHKVAKIESSLCWGCIDTIHEHNAVKVGDLVKFGDELSSYTNKGAALLSINLSVGPPLGCAKAHQPINLPHGYLFIICLTLIWIIYN